MGKNCYLLIQALFPCFVVGLRKLTKTSVRKAALPFGVLNIFLHASSLSCTRTKLLDTNHCQLLRKVYKTATVSAKCKLGHGIIRYDRLSLTPSVSSFMFQVTVYVSYILCTSFVSSTSTNHIPTLSQHPLFSIFHNSDC